MQFTISARNKMAEEPIQKFLWDHFRDIPIDQIDSMFGFTTYSSLYGGRMWDIRKDNPAELDEADLKAMYENNINLRLPLTNHYVSLDEYKANIAYLESYYRLGNALIITNDDLARWIRSDFPDYHLEASVIKNIGSLKKIEDAVKIYNTIVLPMNCNYDEEFLLSIEDKSIIRLFANAGCALTCPSKICYQSISKANKTKDPSLFRCSQTLKDRDLLGMMDMDLDYLQSLGFERFKLLRSRGIGITGH